MLHLYCGLTFISHRCSNDVGVKCLLLLLCAFHAEDRFFRKIEFGAIHFFRFTKLISHISFHLFGCELHLFYLLLISLLQLTLCC